MAKKVRLVIFASGGGSNAKKICEYFNQHREIEVAAILTNRHDAGVIDVAKDYNLPVLVIKKHNLSDGLVEDWLLKLKAEFIILAGFLLLIPSTLISQYKNRILNIHPSLLPKYGGKGMHGHYVHEAVFNNRDANTGMSIHLVNENYDEGQIVFQAQCDVQLNDSPEIIASKVLKLEHQYYSPTIENYIKSFILSDKTN